MLSTVKDGNESKKLLARSGILNFLISNLEAASFLITVIVRIFCWILNTSLLSVEFSQEITLYDMMV